MKQIMTIKYWSRLLFLLPPLLIICGSARAYVQVDFNATIAQGTCSITVPSLIDLGQVNVTSLLGSSWKYAGVAPVNIGVSCSGIQPTGTMAVTLSGSAKNMSSADDNGLIQQDAGTQASLMGIGVFKHDPSQGGGKADLWRNSVTSPTDGSQYLDLDTSSIPATAQVYVALMCGDTADCDTTAGSASGMVSATMTLNVAYH